ncbi:hypothetical protein [Enterococcus sp. HY326]|nr:hypothetical protein [Enterococcus sp. HY326]
MNIFQVVWTEDMRNTGISIYYDIWGFYPHVFCQGSDTIYV